MNMNTPFIGATAALVLATLAIAPASAQQGQSADRGQQSLNQSSRAAESLSRDEIRQVQQALNKKGFDAGDADGILGPETRTALRSFQQQQGIQPSGEADQRTLSALGLAMSQNGRQGDQHSTSGQGGQIQNSDRNQSESQGRQAK